MRIKKYVMWIVLSTACLAACRKDNTVYHLFFYTNLPGEKGQLDLFVDDVQVGRLPFVDHDALNFPDSLLYKTFDINTGTGSHKVEARDNNNELKVSSTIKFTRNSTGSSGTMGGNAMSARNNTIVINLFY